MPVPENPGYARAAVGPVPPTPAPRNGCAWLAFLVALAALGGTLWLSLGMNLIACPLCYYQRSFVMAVVAVLAAGLLTRARVSGLAGWFALPLAVAALGIAGFHEYKEWKGDLECPRGIEVPNVSFNLGTAPQQSLAAIGLLFLLLFFDVARKIRKGFVSFRGAAGLVILGGLLAFGSIMSASSKPIPQAPEPVVGCRPVQK